MAPFRRIHSAFLAVLALCALAVAQQPPATPARAASAPLPPAPQIQKLATMMTGRWNTREKVQASAGNAKGGSRRGTDVIRYGPGNLSLVVEYHSRGRNGSFAGLGVLLWQQDLESYLLYWTDSLSPGILLLRGNLQGDQLVFSGSTTNGANTVYVKQTYSNFARDSFDLVEESAVQGGPLQKDLEVHFTRMGAAQTRSAKRSGGAK